MRGTFFAAVSAVCALAGGGCGSSPICGDGETNFELGEECDDGNTDETDVCLSSCRVRPVPQLTIKWEFNQDLERGFQGDSCFDVGGDKVSVRLQGPDVEITEVIDCSFRQARYRDIPSGMYTASISIADAEGAPLLTMPFEAVIVFGGGTAEETIVVVPPALWATAYRGTFFFRLGWGDPSESCEAAIPAVANNSLLLLVGGVVHTGFTDAGHPVDGSVASPCRPLSEGTAQAVLDVPFGPAEFTVSGSDSTGRSTHQATFATFVGAGINNPELRFDVPLVPSADAGVDAGVDAN